MTAKCWSAQFSALQSTQARTLAALESEIFLNQLTLFQFYLITLSSRMLFVCTQCEFQCFDLFAMTSHISSIHHSDSCLATAVVCSTPVSSGRRVESVIGNRRSEMVFVETLPSSTTKPTLKSNEAATVNGKKAPRKPATAKQSKHVDTDSEPKRRRLIKSLSCSCDKMKKIRMCQQAMQSIHNTECRFRNWTFYTKF